MKFRALIILCFIISCNPVTKENDNCLFTIKELLQKDSKRLAINDQFKNGGTSMLVDKNSDSLFGAYYFYPSGILQSYKFFALPKTYYYNEEYDEAGNLIRTEGKPLVMHLFRKVDSFRVRFTFLFSSLHKKYKNIGIKTNSGEEFKYQNLQTNALLTNIQFLTFELPVVKTFNKLIVFTTAEVQDNCLNSTEVLNDTLTLKDMKL